MNRQEIQIEVPSSKSLTQRALLVAALARGRSEIISALAADDVDVMVRALSLLGRNLHRKENGSVVVEGTPPPVSPKGPLRMGNNGTATRFLAALSLLSVSPIYLDGVEALRQRPMEGLLTALEQLGVRHRCHFLPHCPPVTLAPPTGKPKGRVDLDPTSSSQQLSALLMAGPFLSGGLEILLTRPLPSGPYVDLTLEVMEHFGVKAGKVDDTHYRVPEGAYRAADYEVEGDHSSASYVWAAASLTGRRAEIPNLRTDSRQGDRLFPEFLQQMNRPGELELDLGRCPDIAPTVAVCALFRPSKTRITSVGHLKYKECDRLAVIADELAKLGANITLNRDGWEIRPSELAGPSTLDPHDDHRMAMCFGLVGLRVPELTILNPDCVAKSYSDFWNMLERFR